jgi:hypothetical protein
MVTHKKARTTKAPRQTRINTGDSMSLALNSRLRYYSPEKARERRPWPQQPHVFFANLKLDWQSMLGFARTYGKMLNSESVSEQGVTESDIELYSQMQRLLRGAWQGDLTAIELIQFGAKHYSEQAAYGPISVKPVPTSSGLDIYTHDLWTYIRLAFLTDRDRARVCANPDCIAPYFLAKRKDTKLCGSELCATRAQRQWALDWWNEEGADRRRKSQRKKRRKVNDR